MSSSVGRATVHAGSRIGWRVRTTRVLWRSVWLAEMTSTKSGASDRGPVSRWWVARIVSRSSASCTREPTSTIRKSQTRSRSETRCEDSTTLSWCSATASIRLCRNSRRLSGSSAGHRLVEQQQLRTLGEPERERQLRALPAGQLARLLRQVEPEPRDPLARQRLVPAGVQPRAEAQVVLDAEAAVGRRVLGDEADAGALLGVLGRAGAQHLDRAGVGGEQAGGEVQQRALARAVGADEADHAARGHLDRAVRERGLAPVALGQALGPQSAALTLRAPARGTKGGGEQCLDALVVEAGQPRLAQPALQLGAQRPVRGDRGVGRACA